MTLSPASVLPRSRVVNWLIAITASVCIVYCFCLCMGTFVAGFSSENFGGAAFMVFIGVIGVPLGLSSAYYYAAELIPIFIGQLIIWWLIFRFLKRYSVVRPLQIAASVTCLISFWMFGILAIAATQVI